MANRINGLFEEVITKLPDEEQFRIRGTIFIGSRDLIVGFLNRANSQHLLGPGTNLFIKDENFIFWFTENLEESEYLITLITDNFDEKSDDYIKGLIVYKISEWSYSWKTMQSIHNLQIQDPEERQIRFMHITKQNTPVGGPEHEEYERNVDEEAKRLGFFNEILAYDTQ